MYNPQPSAGKPKFAVGTSVRVKSGVIDPDFPDMELGDWAGTISQIEIGKVPAYLVQWSPETLENVDLACRDYCRREDMASDKMWLLEEDLRLDSATRRRSSGTKSRSAGRWN